jgi:glycosyltransferase involved in cell wall biosynthesis
MKTLVLYAYYTDQLSYFDDWIDAFRQHREFEAKCVNVFNIRNKEVLRNIQQLILSIDVIVIHHSMNGDTLKYLQPFVKSLKDRQGTLVSFVGNELSLPTIGMAPKIEILKELEVDFIATQLLFEAGKWLYKDCSSSKIISLPHGLNPLNFRKKIDITNRTIDIGTRSAKYGVWLGDNDRNAIIQYFNLERHGLRLDLGLDPKDQKRFNRAEWAGFLNKCKGTLSTEAGSFFLDPNDQIVNEVFQYLKNRSNKFVLPNETFLYQAFKLTVPLVLRQLLKPVLEKQFVGASNIDQDADFEEIYDKFFSDVKKAPVYTKAVSSRHFDAIGTHTLNIMYPGRYNDILKPNEHYFELKKDHSNVEELILLLENDKKIEDMTRSSYEFVYKNHTHSQRLDKLFNELSLAMPRSLPLFFNGKKDIKKASSKSELCSQKHIDTFKEKRILYIIGSLRTGGTENHLSQIASGLTERNWKIDICLLSPYIEVNRSFLDDRIKIFRLPKLLHENFLYKKFYFIRFFVILFYSLLVLKVLLSKRPHFVHMFLPHAYIVGGFLSILCRVPVKLMSRRSMNVYQKKSRLIALCEKFLHKRMNKILGNSQAVVDELFFEGVENDKLQLIHNGINLDYFKFNLSKSEVRKELNIDKNKFVIVIIANLISYKGHADLLKALNLIKNSLKDWSLIIIGDDRGEKSNLMRIIKKFDLEKNVKFEGEMKTIQKHLTASDLGVLCSHQEGFSNAILEYMAASLPVVATRVGGNSEAVKDGFNGYMVEAQQYEDLAVAILKVYKSKNRGLMGKKGKELTEKVFSLEKCIEEYEEVYLGNY